MRTLKIIGRIRRNLGDLSTGSIQNPEIIDEMNEAQNVIIQKTKCLERILDLTTDDGKDSYEIEEMLLVKNVKFDNQDIELLPHDEFFDKIAGVLSASRPIYATIFAENLIFAPVPTYSAPVSIVGYAAKSAEEISESVEPEIPMIFDRAIEYYVTAQLIKGNEKLGYMELFERELSEFSFDRHAKYLKKQVRSNW